MTEEKKVFFSVTRRIIDGLFWLKTAAGPVILGGVFGFLLYVWLKDNRVLAVICGSVVAVIGVVCGILLAEHIRKTTGTERFMSKTVSSSDADDVLRNKKA